MRPLSLLLRFVRDAAGGAMSRRALGVQAIHLIRRSADDCNAIDKAALRAKIDVASVRPTPGTSDALLRPVGGEFSGIVPKGPKTVKVFDCVGLLSVKLRDGKIGAESHKVESWDDVFKAKGGL